MAALNRLKSMGSYQERLLASYVFVHAACRWSIMPVISPERVLVIAAAARIKIEPQSAERVAKAVAAPITRLAEGQLTIPFEIEPLSFAAAQLREIGR